jgi:hypothetical protein
MRLLEFASCPHLSRPGPKCRSAYAVYNGVASEITADSVVADFVTWDEDEGDVSEPEAILQVLTRALCAALITALTFELNFRVAT